MRIPTAFAALLVMAGVAVMLGSYPVGIGDIFAGAEDPLLRVIVLELRLPRILLAVLCGAAMGLSGVILQSLTRNPLAAPGLVGVEAGASVTVLIAMILWPSALAMELYPLAAMAGGLAVALLIAGLAWSVGGTPLRLLLVGVGISAMLAAVADLLITYGRIEAVESALLWLAGSLHRAGWDNVRSQLLWLMLSGGPALLLHRHFDLFLLGEAVARSRGLHVAGFRNGVLLASVMLTASAVANVGTMSFIGLLAPHAARLLVGERHAVLLPMAALLGGGIVLLGDTLGRTLFAPLQIPAGLLIAGIGAPYLLFLLSRKGGLR